MAIYFYIVVNAQACKYPWFSYLFPLEFVVSSSVISSKLPAVHRLNGTSRDKVSDIDTLEQAFMLVSKQNCLELALAYEAMAPWRRYFWVFLLPDVGKICHKSVISQSVNLFGIPIFHDML